MEYHREVLSDGLYVCVNKNHSFGGDALLLAEFATVKPGSAVYDLGSGCGIISAALFAREVAPRSVISLELSEEASSLARLTAESPLIDGRMTAVNGDIRRVRELFKPGSADLVISNPPYFEENSGKLPADAQRRAARSQISCNMDDVCAAAAYLLRPGGYFAVCQRPEYALRLADAMRAAGIEPKRTATAAHSSGKKPFLILFEGIKGAKPGLNFEAQITLNG